MKVWGILSDSAEKRGFEVVLDEEGYLLLQNQGRTVTKFDPLQFTMPEVCREVERSVETTVAGKGVKSLSVLHDDH